MHGAIYDFGYYGGFAYPIGYMIKSLTPGGIDIDIMRIFSKQMKFNKRNIIFFDRYGFEGLPFAVYE